MNATTNFLKAAAAALLIMTSNPCLALISIRNLPEIEAEKMGLTIKRRLNGDAGEWVRLEFLKQGSLKNLAYVEFHLKDAHGKQLLSAKLPIEPVDPNQPDGIQSVQFSALPSQLESCSFFIVISDSPRGHIGYLLNIKDYLNRKNLNK
ncbi:MAG: hypothetical protein LR011_08525 [Verrucomicrobia bacterium]|nr:hypothetical protein [Verrucomicrobiota bacterium]